VLIRVAYKRLEQSPGAFKGFGQIGQSGLVCLPDHFYAASVLTLSDSCLALAFPNGSIASG
jgi:hypothetical protein